RTIGSFPVWYVIEQKGEGGMGLPIGMVAMMPAGEVLCRVQRSHAGIIDEWLHQPPHDGFREDASHERVRQLLVIHSQRLRGIGVLSWLKIVRLVKHSAADTISGCEAVDPADQVVRGVHPLF